MPMLADIEDPPRSRVRGMLLGIGLALPLVAAVLVWLLPPLVAAVLGGSKDLDARLRAEDRYVQELCATTQHHERDQKLCQCAGTVEFPSLDCQHQVKRWSLARQRERCAEPSVEASARSFCSCVEAVAEASSQPDFNVQAAYGRCEGLNDALALPQVATVAAAN